MGGRRYSDEVPSGFFRTCPTFNLVHDGRPFGSALDIGNEGGSKNRKEKGREGAIERGGEEPGK